MLASVLKIGKKNWILISSDLKVPEIRAIFRLLENTTKNVSFSFLFISIQLHVHSCLLIHMWTVTKSSLSLSE